MKIGKVIGVFLIIGVLGCILYSGGLFEDAKPVIDDWKDNIGNMKYIAQEASFKIQNKINTLLAGDPLEENEGASFDEEEVFYQSAGEMMNPYGGALSMSHSYNHYYLKQIENIYGMASSKFIWFVNNERVFNDGVSSSYCNFYNVSKETMYEKASENKIKTMVKQSSDYITNRCFNKVYNVEKDETDCFEQSNQPYNPWSDDCFDGLRADDFYIKYEIVTKCKTPILKYVITGSAHHEESEELSVVDECIFVYEVEVTTVSAKEHPMEWLPQAGETKMVTVAVSGAHDLWSNFCLSQATIL